MHDKPYTRSKIHAHNWSQVSSRVSKLTQVRTATQLHSTARERTWTPYDRGVNSDRGADLAFLLRRVRHRYTWARPRRSWRDRIEDPVPHLVGALVLTALLFTLALQTAWAWHISIPVGLGFTLTVVGLVLTLLTRKTAGLTVWMVNIGLSVVGLIVAMSTFAASCDADCLARF